MNDFLNNAVLYEIYPTSFYDGNGDGIGDFVGMTEKLDYVKELGADIIWVNPFFLSPFRDGGYDVEDFYKVDPRFGTIRDFENFVKKCKKIGIKLLIDLVMGHTSVKCKWFKQSAKAKRNKYSDYYIWKEGMDMNQYKGKTLYGLYERNGSFYVNYYACQPALNYGFVEKDMEDDCKDGNGWQMHYKDERLKPVRDEMMNVMKFWLSKGVDGFRVDMAPDVIKYCKYNDENTEALEWFWGLIIDTVKKEYPNLIMLSEWCCPTNAVKCGFDLDYVGHDNPFYNTLFRNEPNMNLFPEYAVGPNYFSKDGKGDLTSFIETTEKLHFDVRNKGYFSIPTGCHDEIRMSTGKGIDVVKCIFAFLLTFKHVPFIYYGDEIGITHNFEVNIDGGYIRTGCRTPMQWNRSKNRGFSTAKKKDLYLPVNSDVGIDVASQEKKEDSLLNIVKSLIKIRKNYCCLDANSDIIYIEKNYPLIFKRRNDKNEITVLINPSNNVYTRKMEFLKKLFSVNCDFEDGNIVLKKQSFAILLNK